MLRIGVDVGSAYTKYCLMDGDAVIRLWSERTPVRQRDYFKSEIGRLRTEYGPVDVVSCGYGRRNIGAIRNINELSALARGCYYRTGAGCYALDIGGQDSKVIEQKDGILRQFYVNDKCAAGSGAFLSGVLDMLGARFDSIDLRSAAESDIILSNTCAVFAQSEIVELVADNRSTEEIIAAVIRHIFSKAINLTSQTDAEAIMITGGISRIPGVARLAAECLGIECYTVDDGEYLAAIGCALAAAESEDIDGRIAGK